MPHEHVYVRLGPSPIHGVGVFAVRDIPRGTPVFGDDDQPVIRVPARLVRRLRAESRTLYEDFCVLRGNEYLCPPSFNLLTVSWYLNHSDTPNTRCDQDLRFVATKRIRKGEEVTADYRTYSDDPLPSALNGGPVRIRPRWSGWAVPTAWPNPVLQPTPAKNGGRG